MADVDVLIGQSKRQNNIDALTLQKKCIEAQINVFKRPSKATPKFSTKQKRIEFLKEGFTWEQGEKFVRIYIEAEGIRPNDDSKIVIPASNVSLSIAITDIGKTKSTRSLELKGFWRPIDPSKSYYTVKNDYVTFFAKKLTEGKRYSMRVKSITDIHEYSVHLFCFFSNHQ